MSSSQRRFLVLGPGVGCGDARAGGGDTIGDGTHNSGSVDGAVAVDGEADGTGSGTGSGDSVVGTASSSSSPIPAAAQYSATSPAHLHTRSSKSSLPRLPLIDRAKFGFAFVHFG